MNKEIAIKVENLSKTFRIPHEKISSLRGAFVSAFRRDKGYEEFEALNDVSFEVHPVKSGEAGARQFNGVKKGELEIPFNRNQKGLQL